MTYQVKFAEGDLIRPMSAFSFLIAGKEIEVSTDDVGMVYQISKDISNDGNYFLGIFWFNLPGDVYRNAPHPDGIHFHHWTQIKRI